jgi:hypothetical protein
MKKLMLTCAAIMIAAMVQAATFNWFGITQSTNPNAAFPGWMGTSSTFYLVFLGAESSGFGDGGFDINNRPTVGNAYGAGTVVGSFNQTSGYNYGAGTAFYAYSASQTVINGNYAMLYIDEGTTDTYGVHTFNISGLADTSSPPTANAGNLDAGMFTSVPEPTSMALLALGIAALGLRRRRS